MSDIQKKPLDVAGATVDFFTYTIKGIQYFEFDTSKCAPPEPMVNAMAGLKLIDGFNKKLVMINHKYPAGLMDKIGKLYHHTKEDTLDGNVKLIFSYIAKESNKADLSDSSCNG